MDSLQECKMQEIMYQSKWATTNCTKDLFSSKQSDTTLNICLNTFGAGGCRQW